MSQRFVFRLLAVLGVAACLVGQPAKPVAAARTADATLGLPAFRVPDTYPATRISLGRKLFMDRRLSGNGTMSCGMCHVPEQGFSVTEVTTAIGIEGRSLRRNAPTVLNVGFNRYLFHDGRETSLEAQIWGPLLATDEMGNRSREAVVAKISELPEYIELFQAVFPGQKISPENIAVALAAYERSLASAGSRFDRWYFGGETGALTAAEQRGFTLFRGKARCVSCHSIAEQHALFTDDQFHNLGVGQGKPKRSASIVKVQLAPGIETNIALETLDKLFGVPPPDDGRFEVTGMDKDRYAYRTPTLRNIELTGPYMHDGSIATLREVVEFFDRGGNANPWLDADMVPLSLSDNEKDDLVAFLRSLTGANVDTLAAQARAAASTAAFR